MYCWGCINPPPTHVPPFVLYIWNLSPPASSSAQCTQRPRRTLPPFCLEGIAKQVTLLPHFTLKTQSDTLTGSFMPWNSSDKFGKLAFSFLSPNRWNKSKEVLELDRKVLTHPFKCMSDNMLYVTFLHFIVFHCFCCCCCCCCCITSLLGRLVCYLGNTISF